MDGTFLVILVIVVLVVNLVLSFIFKGTHKVDQGFKVNYYQLSYRRKMIRTLWMILVCILVIGSLFLINMSTLEIVVISVLLSATLIAQLIYTYVKWKGEADSE